MSTYYQILGVSENATSQEIKTAYRELMKKYHPDRNPNDQDSLKYSQLINEAYSVLNDPIKRVEYDNLIRIQYETENTYYKDEYESHKYDKSVNDIPNYHCEKCGRKDSTLRVTIFIWVVSLFLVTFKQGWGHILCSKCRIKYSLLFNIQVFFMGWWGFPFGPIYTIEALFKNSFGGIQPEDNNASLLAILAYDFYLQGKYIESFLSIRESVNLRPNQHGKEFLLFIKKYLKKNEYNTSSDIYNANPAYFNVPMLIILFIFSVIILFPSYFSTGTSYEPPRFEWVSPPTTESRTETINTLLLQDYGIDIKNINILYQESRNSFNSVVRYLENNVPFSGIEMKDGRMVRMYEFDRSKLSERDVNLHTIQLSKHLEQYHHYMDTIHNIRLNDNEHLDEFNDLKNNVMSQYEYIASAYFNSSIITISIATVNQFYREGKISQQYIQRVKDIGANQYIKLWLNNSEYKLYYGNLLDRLNEIVKYNERLSIIESRLKSLEIEIDNTDKTASQLSERMQRYRNIGRFQDYYNLVEQYNKLIETLENLIDQYNNYVEDYNSYLVIMHRLDIDSAFNKCIDTRMIFPKFELVDIH